MRMARLILACILFCISHADGKRGKLRSLGLIIKDVHEIEEKLINSSSTHTLQWQPSYSNPFAFKDDDELFFGVLPEPKKTRSMPRSAPRNRIAPVKPGQKKELDDTVKLPKQYDAREMWGKKCPSFKHIMYQGSCGNCWAVAATAMINDRKCMYNDEGEEEFFHSAKHLTTCLRKGCDGGWFDDALDYWISQGIPSGGDLRMHQTKGCSQYPLDTATMKSDTCKSTCDDGITITPDARSFGGARYEIKSKNEKEIMAEIYLYGPVIATFDVYEDFARYYKSGVYKRTSNVKKGGHAAKLLGWGVEKGVKFWYAANSWGKDWGDRGFFKIQRGVNECGIESNIHAALPVEGLHDHDE